MSLALSNIQASVQFHTASDLIFFVGHIFHVPVILHCISHPIKQDCITLWILVQSDTVNDLKLFVGQCDLYFMV